MKRAWLSVLGNTTRDTHAALDGVPEDSEGLWNLGGVDIPWPSHVSLPPDERINCFPGNVLISGRFVGSQRGRYDGVFTEIITKLGAKITLTPNHPVVTSEGLISASEIKPGQKVLTYDLEVDSFASPSLESASSHSFCGSNDVENKPFPIEQVFEAFLCGSIFGSGSSSVKIRRTQVDDFYGDA
jgi:hypothetical protein